MSNDQQENEKPFWTPSTILITLILFIIVIAIFIFAFTQGVIWVAGLGLLYAVLLLIPVVLRMQRRTHFMGYFMHILTIIFAVAVIILFYQLRIMYGGHPLLWDYLVLALSMLFCALLLNFIAYKYMSLIALPQPQPPEV
jgi:hypothetical protein